MQVAGLGFRSALPVFKDPCAFHYRPLRFAWVSKEILSGPLANISAWIWVGAEETAEADSDGSVLHRAPWLRSTLPLILPSSLSPLGVPWASVWLLSPPCPHLSQVPGAPGTPSPFSLSPRAAPKHHARYRLSFQSAWSSGTPRTCNHDLGMWNLHRVNTQAIQVKQSKNGDGESMRTLGDTKALAT